MGRIRKPDQVIRVRCSRVLPGLLLAIFLSACTGDDRPALQGSLYFATGKYLAALNLGDGSTSVIANLGDAELLSLSPVLDERLLLSVIGTENQRQISQLVLYDIATRQRLDVLSGGNGHYLPGTRVLVFDDGVRTWITERIDGSWEKFEVVQHRYNASVDIMPLSATRFVYRVEDALPQLYDYVTGRSTELSDFASRCSLDRALWVADSEEMLCQARHDDGSFEYAYVALDGTRGEAVPLPGERDLRPLAHIRDQDVLVLTERWQGLVSSRWKWAVWIYHLDTGEFYRLLEDQYLGDSVVYAARHDG